MNIFLESLAATIVVGLVLRRLRRLRPTERLAKRAAELKARARGTTSRAVTKKAFSLKTSLVRTDGTTQPAVIRVYPDAVYIYSRNPDALLAYVKLEDIKALGQLDLSRGGHTMAGFAIVAPEGQYQFLHQGSFALVNVREVVGVIRDTVQAATMQPLPMLGDEVGYLHGTGQQCTMGG